jgi:hypothetical protein
VLDDVVPIVDESDEEAADSAGSRVLSDGDDVGSASSPEVTVSAVMSEEVSSSTAADCADEVTVPVSS